MGQTTDVPPQQLTQACLEIYVRENCLYYFLFLAEDKI